MKPRTHFDRLFMDCDIPTMPFLQRRFEEMSAPNWPPPYPAFKGRDSAGARFIFCRRPMQITHDDGTTNEGVFPAIIFQRRYEKTTGFMLAFPKEGLSHYITQVCEDAGEVLPNLTQALVGDPVVISTTGAKVFVNPGAEEEEEEGGL